MNDTIAPEGGPVVIYCINPTKTTKKGEYYTGYPVKKGKGMGGYNHSYTGQWESCSLKVCTSFRFQDKLGTYRIVSKKRFQIR